MKKIHILAGMILTCLALSYALSDAGEAGHWSGWENTESGGDIQCYVGETGCAGGCRTFASFKRECLDGYPPIECVAGEIQEETDYSEWFPCDGGEENCRCT